MNRSSVLIKQAKDISTIFFQTMYASPGHVPGDIFFNILRINSVAYFSFFCKAFQISTIAIVSILQ